MRLLAPVIIILSTAILTAQPYEASVAQNENWNGWEAIIAENGIITTSTVPAIGARVMQYDLGQHSSIFHNHSMDGDIFEPAFNNSWYNFGGFKNWPSPQYGSGRWGWPPPPTLDYGEYTSEIINSCDDSVVIRFTGPVEQYRTPDLQFIREMTLYQNSSRVKMKQILINHAASSQNWGIWDITQAITNHIGKNDYEYFWIYFPINPQSVFGPDGVTTQRSSAAWVGEVASGIYGTQFVPGAEKLFADPHNGWICYVDERDGVAYAKTFPVFEESSYPDDEARVAVYMAANYVEVEVMGPVEDIPANEGKIDFTINWWAAKVNGPILNVNNVCAVNHFLSLSDESITGNYGVFYTGKAKTVFLDEAGAILGEGQEWDVTPLDNFSYSESVSFPANTARIELRIYKLGGELIGILDSADISDLTNIQSQAYCKISTFKLSQNYPNPFNPSTQIEVDLKDSGPVQLIVYDITGRIVRILSEGFQYSGKHRFIWNGDDLKGQGVPAGIYLCRLNFTDQLNKNHTMIRKMQLIR
ncbi:T9SS type A sorting domain-containing protein [bacterium]|nr:T9SS type A sorting domain-containing protein [bacterium]